MTLLENNLAVSVIDEIKKKLKDEFVDKSISRKEIEEKIKAVLKDTLSKILLEPFDLIKKIEEKKEKPFVIVFFGINGAGKTTTIAKVAHLLQKSKLKCVLAASDTFRAASIEQLEKHAAALNINVIKHQYGADPAAVAFYAIAHSKAAGKDVVLVDTAGRMHTKADLMREMEKIVRVSKPDLKIFIAESITGNDAVEQAAAFNKAIGIDAVILTKADVDEKGGAMISVSNVTGKPILFLGTGQKYDDLEYFDKTKIINSIF
jgi:fused signal recognition particle receptor